MRSVSVICGQFSATGLQVHQPQLVVEEAHVERRVVDHQLGAADELEEFVRHLAKPRLVLQELRAQPVHLQRTQLDLGLPVEVAVEVVARQAPVHDLHRANLDDPMAEHYFEPGGFGVEDDLSHADPNYWSDPHD